MKNINTYVTNSEYAADSNRSTNESTVSYIEDGAGVIYDGKNVIVDKNGAGIGDVCVYDAILSSVMFIKSGTYYAATLPASITIIGVVYYRTENKVFIVSKNNLSSARWGEGYKVKLSGFNFTTGGSFTVTVNETTTASIAYVNTDTLTTIATKIATALTNSEFTSATGWSVTADNTNNCIAVVRNYYTPLITYFHVTDAALKVVATIITATDYQCTFTGLLTPYSNITRVDRSRSWYAGANYPKFYSYYYTNGGANTNEPLMSTNTVKYSVFNVTDNPILTNHYGTGETGYTKYIKDKMLKYPFSKDAIIDDDGQHNTNRLASLTYTDIGGVIKPIYPAAYNAKSFGVTVAGHTTGFEIGNWWLPSVKEMYLLIKDVQLSNTDAVNITLAAIGGNNVLASGYYPWTSTEYGTNGSWNYDGYTGAMNGSTKYSTYSVRAVTAF